MERTNKDMSDKKMWFFFSGEEKADILHTDWSTQLSSNGYNSRSCGYDTMEELIEKELISLKGCTCCGLIYTIKYSEPLHTLLFEKGLCYSCNYWLNLIDHVKIDSNKIVVKGVVYSIGDEKAAGFRGFGGATWKIKRFDQEKVIISTNLWCRGNVPKHLLDKFPDNAEFIK